MRNIFILISLLLSSLSLFCESITFTQLYNIAKKSSPEILEISQNLKIENNVISKQLFPESIRVSSSITPMYTLYSSDSSSNSFNFGEITTSIDPFYNTSINLIYSFENDSSLSITYSPFKSNRDILAAKNIIKNNIINAEEQLENVFVKIRDLYYEIYFLREKYLLDKDSIEILNKEIFVKENLLKLNKLKLTEIEDLYIELLNKEVDIINKEILIIEKEDELSNITGIEIKTLTFNLDDLTKSDIILSNNKRFYESYNYLKLKEDIRDQKLALKEIKQSIFPQILLTGGITTSDFEDFVGFISLSGNMVFNFSYSKDKQTEGLILNQLERKIVEYEKKFNNQINYKHKTKELNIKQIDIIEKSLNSSNNRLKIAEYNYQNGNILEYEFLKSVLNNKLLSLNLEESKVNLIINY